MSRPRDAANFDGNSPDLIAQAQPSQNIASETADVLDEVQSLLSKWMVLTPEQIDAITLFVAHSWVYDAGDTAAYLHIFSVREGSGKSRLMSLMNLLVREPLLIAGGSSSALFREIDDSHPTLLFNEIDTVMKGDKETAHAIRQVLNAGSYRGDGAIIRAKLLGNQISKESFDPFCPKVLCGVGKNILDRTTQSRCIPIEVIKKKRNEGTTERFRQRKEKWVLDSANQHLKHWANTNKERVALQIEGDPFLPQELEDRQCDVWEPLLAIAELAGEDWAGRARKAAVCLSQKDYEDGNLEFALLNDCHKIFQQAGFPSKLSRDALYGALLEMEESPWTNKLVSSHTLVKMLSKYKVKTTTLRTTTSKGEEFVRGFILREFKDAWERHLPDLES